MQATGKYLAHVLSRRCKAYQSQAGVIHMDLFLDVCIYVVFFLFVVHCLLLVWAAMEAIARFFGKTITITRVKE
jgi:hypothetical protein